MKHRIALVLGFLCLPVCMHAQFTASIEGSVKDNSGAEIPGAEVTVLNENLGVKRTTKTQNGLFRVGELAAGTYSVMITAPGFKRWTISAMPLRTDETRAVNPTLEVGDASTSVNVSAEVAAVNISTADVTNYISQETMANQPLPQNSVWQLSILVPGVTGSGETGQANGTFANNYEGEMGLRINAAGQRQDSNEIMFNGSYAEVPSRAGSFMVSPIPDSLQEFRVEAVNFSASKGRHGGAFLELVSKSGSNDWHGTLGYLFTNNQLTGRTIAQQRIANFARNNGWATIGGPVQKNKTFIFGSFDILRAETAYTSVAVVETPEFRDYVVRNSPSSLAAQIFKISRTSTPTANILSVGQLKTRTPGVFDSTATFPDNLPAVGTATETGTNETRGQQYQVRVDHNFSQKDRIFGFAYWSDGFSYSFGGAPNLIRPGYIQPSPRRNIWTKGEWTHLFSPNVVNSASFRWSKARGAGENPLDAPVNTVPIVNITGMLGYGVRPLSWFTPTWEWHDLLSVNRGKHSLQMGVEQALPRDTVPWEIALTRPTYTFGNLLDFAQDRPFSQTGPTVRVDTGQVRGAFLKYGTLYTGAFLQDNWKVAPWLSINLGVRFDDYSHGITYTKDSDPGCYLYPAAGNDHMQNIARGTARCGNSVLPDRRLGGISPRFGFAWDVFRNGSLSVRGGYGMFRDRIGQNWFSTLGLVGPPLIATPSLSHFQGDRLTYGLGNQTGEGWIKPDVSYTLNEAGGVRGLRSNIMSIDQGMRIPQIHNWMLSIQQRLRSDFTAEVNYIGSVNRHLPVQTDRNRYAGDLLDGRLDRLNPFFGEVRTGWSGASSSAHLVSAMLDKRFSSRWSTRAVYTYGRVRDTFSTTGLPIANVPTTPVFDAWDLRGQRGRADFDIRNRFTFDAMYAAAEAGPDARWYSHVAGGWRLGLVGMLQSGTPFTVLTTAPFGRGDYNADGFNFDKPNTPSFGNSVSGLGRQDYLNGVFRLADFPIPSAGRQGNLGRNTFEQPGLINTSMTVMRKFRVPWIIGERGSLQLRGDFFNLFNRVNLDRVRNNMTDPLFGRVTDSIGPRSVQVGARLEF